MKNVRPRQLKKCINFSLDEFNTILNSIYPDSDVNTYYDLDGLSIEINENVVDTYDLNKKLAKYFDVDIVTSIHADDCEFLGVWIVYEDGKDENT